ncbi:MAG: peptide ABC transporter permease [Thiotrichales bacterium]|nr:peptide ABC transporter permease [Thiotrichales bacterium]
MPILRLALQSLYNRRATALLTVIAIALSVSLLLGVEKLRRDARSAFANTLSGTDLIVGARSGAIPLLLYSVFRIGNATNNITWESYQEIASHPKVRWTVPLSLGDSHRGFRVLGTSRGYFEHYRYAGERQLKLAEGVVFGDVFDTVLGAVVAEQLGYRTGDEIVIAHGTGSAGLVEHDDKPFRVTGILEPTGTPVDRTLHVSLAGIEAMHVDWFAGAPIRGRETPVSEVREMDLQPAAITAFLVGLESRIAVFKLQRRINDYRREPLLAIVPGVALQELWDLMGVAENALRAVSIMVVVTGLLGMLTVILSSLESRRREMAVLRSVGARPLHVLGLFMCEAGLLASLGVALGVVVLYAVVLIAQPMITAAFGIYLNVESLKTLDLALLAAVVAAAFVVGCVPAFKAYRQSLADGLSMRI